MQYYQQGDVLLKKVSALPKEAKKIKGKVLQESEITGHHHHFKGNAAVDLYQTLETPTNDKTITPNFGKFIIVKEMSDLFHGKGFDATPAALNRGDHDAISIPPGIYEIDIVREYDFDANEVSRVVD